MYTTVWLYYRMVIMVVISGKSIKFPWHLWPFHSQSFSYEGSLIIFNSRYKSLITKTKVRCGCVANWVLSFAIVTLLNTLSNNYGRPQTRCMMETYMPRRYVLSIYVPVVLICLIIILVLYGKMAYLLKRRSVEMASMSSNTQINQSSAEASKNVMKLAFFVTGKELIAYFKSLLTFN